MWQEIRGRFAFSPNKVRSSGASAAFEKVEDVASGKAFDHISQTDVHTWQLDIDMLIAGLRALTRAVQACSSPPGSESAYSSTLLGRLWGALSCLIGYPCVDLSSLSNSENAFDDPTTATGGTQQSIIRYIRRRACLIRTGSK